MAKDELIAKQRLEINEKTLEIKPLEWTEIQEPNASCRYHHISAKTPFGPFEIIWKGWKDYDCPAVSETPWGEYLVNQGSTLEDAKVTAESEYHERIKNCMEL